QAAIRYRESIERRGDPDRDGFSRGIGERIRRPRPVGACSRRGRSAGGQQGNEDEVDAERVTETAHAAISYGAIANNARAGSWSLAWSMNSLLTWTMSYSTTSVSNRWLTRMWSIAWLLPSWM